MYHVSRKNYTGSVFTLFTHHFEEWWRPSRLLKKFSYQLYRQKICLKSLTTQWKRYMNTCYVFLINGHLIYCETKWFYVAQYLFKLIAYSNYINTFKKLPWYWQKSPLRSPRLNWPLHVTCPSLRRKNVTREPQLIKK